MKLPGNGTSEKWQAPTSVSSAESQQKLRMTTFFSVLVFETIVIWGPNRHPGADFDWCHSIAAPSPFALTARRRGGNRHKGRARNLGLNGSFIRFEFTFFMFPF